MSASIINSRQFWSAPAYAVVLLILLSLPTGCRPVSTREASVTILPFTASGPGEKGKQDYFSDGMTGEIIDRLSEIKKVKVTPLAVSLHYKNSKKEITTIARELNTATVLTGSITRKPSALELEVILFDGTNGEAIWSATYDREMKDIFELQESLAELVCGQLSAAMTEAEKAKTGRRPTENLEAFDQYERGRYCYSQRTKTALNEGIGHFNRAISLDSNYAKAWSGKADCYAALGYGSYASPASTFTQAESAARESLRLDSTLAEPHVSLGYVQFYYHWNWAQAEREFREGIRLNPTYGQAYSSYGYFLTAMERYAEAKTILGKAKDLDPLSAACATDLAFSQFYSGDLSHAIPNLENALRINPSFPLAHVWLGRIWQDKSDYANAIKEYSRTLELIPEWPVAIAALGSAYGFAGEKAQVESVLKRLTSDTASMYVTPYGVALAYAALTDKDHAFDCLNKAYADRSNWLVWLKQDRRWKNIKEDKRFSELVSRIGLPVNETDHRLP